MKLFLVLILVQVTSGFMQVRPASTKMQLAAAESPASDVVEMTVDMPPRGSGLQVNLKIQPVLPGPSEFVEVRYKLPFGLDVAPQKGLAVCTKDGSGGEKVGDVLRYTSQWSLGLPQGSGLVSQAAAFSGGIGWQCTMFNVLKAGRWEEVVAALTSNVEVSEKSTRFSSTGR